MAFVTRLAGRSWTRQARWLIPVSLACFMAASCDGPGQSSTPAPAAVQATPTPTDSLALLAASVTVGAIAAANGQVAPGSEVATDDLGRAGIAFAPINGKDAVCTVNHYESDVGRGMPSSVTTRSPTTNHFMVQTRGSSLCHVSGNAAVPGPKIKTAGMDLTFTQDPAIRVIVGPRESSRVAVFEGSVEVSFDRPPRGLEPVIDLAAGEEVSLDLATGEAGVAVARFTRQEEREFSRLAASLADRAVRPEATPGPTPPPSPTRAPPTATQAPSPTGMPAPTATPTRAPSPVPATPAVDTAVLELRRGWNLVSVIRDAGSLDELAEGSPVVSVAAFDPSTGWLVSTRVEGGPFAGTLHSLKAGTVYWFDSADAARLPISYTGEPPPDSLALKQGWTYLPFVPGQPVGAQSVFDYLAPLDGSWLAVATVDMASGEWQVATRPDADLSSVQTYEVGIPDVPPLTVAAASSDLQFLEAGRGYVIYMAADAKLSLDRR